MSAPTLRALVIDHDAHALAQVSDLLTRKGFRVSARATPGDALDYVRRARPDLVLLGSRFWENGWGVLLRSLAPQTPVFPTVEPDGRRNLQRLGRLIGPDAA